MVILTTITTAAITSPTNYSSSTTTTTNSCCDNLLHFTYQSDLASSANTEHDISQQHISRLFKAEESAVSSNTLNN